MRVGDKAPEFETIDESGNPFRLVDHRGKRIVVYFYPKDDSVNCTREACSFRDSFHVFEDAGIPVVGISGGSMKSHRKFKEKNMINFPLLVDRDKSIAKLYGVYKPLRIFGKEILGVQRVTFLIDGNGNIEAIFGGSEGREKVRSSRHAQQVLKYWKLQL
ncbi:MAG: peroxiredoxin [Candidatus Thorarchaeota archaeon]